MGCYNCLNFLNREIDMPEFVRRFGGDCPTGRFRRKIDKFGLGRVIWCKKQQLPREYYVESTYLTKLELPGCPFREVEAGEE